MFRILEYVKNLGGIGSIAHNASSPEFIKHLVDNNLLDSLSVDLKAHNPEKLMKIAGLPSYASYSMWNNTLKTLKILQDAKDVKVDIRTCVFNDTDYGLENKFCFYIKEAYYSSAEL